MTHCSHTPGMIRLDQALERLLQACPDCLEVEFVPVTQALGRVLAEEVASPIAVPAYDNSAMDGYALRVADLAAGRRLPVAQWIPAGKNPEPLASGSVARVFTGAPIPPGADAVVMQERCVEADGMVELPEGIALGEHIRCAGEDVQVGDVVLQEGVRLRPQDLGMAASVGLAELPVRRRLKVALLTTGDELAQPGEALRPGQIYDSNGPMIAALLAQLGCECIGPRGLPDDAAATRAALAQAAEEADVIVTTGGVSVGEEDHIRPAVEALGSIDMWRVAIKPGKPFAFGRVGDTPLLGLPGNPSSSFVTFLILARPFLCRMQGRHAWAGPEFLLTAAFKHDRPDPKREEFLRARLTQGVVEIYPHQGSGVLSSAAWAHGLVRVAPGRKIQPRDVVPYIPLSHLLS